MKDHVHLLWELILAERPMSLLAPGKSKKNCGSDIAKRVRTLRTFWKVEKSTSFANVICEVVFAPSALLANG